MDIRRRVHFVGIGGIGMSSLAQYYLAKGWRVSGSDLVESEMLVKLKKAGAEIFIGHKAVNLLERVDRVIFSAAIKEDNPELEQARILESEIISYAQALGELTRQYITIAVSGAHGKSTTTALLSLMLIEAGLDPTVIIGTRLKEFGGPSPRRSGFGHAGGGNFRFGQSRYLIIEADEYNKSFLNFFPTIAVITNIDKEHLDTYGSLDGVIKNFAKYFKNVGSVGALIVNAKDENTKKTLEIWGGDTKVVKFGGPHFAKASRGDSPPWRIKIPGDFNQLNAEAAWQAAKLLGVGKLVAEKAISNYCGSWRRMEELAWKRPSFAKASAGKQKFFSDYAHHPTEIKVTIKALKESFPKKKLVVVFQPHQLERLNNLFNDFIFAFDGADKLILMPVYQVTGREYSGQKTAKDLYEAIKKEGVYYLKNFAQIVKLTREFPNSVVVFMGAGDIDNGVRKFFKSKLL
ncbi:MAG: UDP-N-acetylmuramate--L-alanine ligase [Patescibacteria group bacterium]